MTALISPEHAEPPVGPDPAVALARDLANGAVACLGAPRTDPDLPVAMAGALHLLTWLRHAYPGVAAAKAREIRHAELDPEALAVMLRRDAAALGINTLTAATAATA
jgi:hypothetical protein